MKIKTTYRFLRSPRSPLNPIVVNAARRLNLGSFAGRVGFGAFERPHYAYCVYRSAYLAKKLGHKAVSVIEFGVAGGNGLVLLEDYAQQVSAELGIGIEVYGFDNATGLPEPKDYRDLPYHWKAGFFKMDEAALRARLRIAKLVMGDVEETSKTFFDEFKPAPIGAVLHDLDFYSSTRPALEMFHSDEKYRLPRVFCYFDDIIGGEEELYNDFTGVRLAISEFNESSEKKLSPAYHLTTSEDPKTWHHMIYVLHDFKHSDYNSFIGETTRQFPLHG